MGSPLDLAGRRAIVTGASSGLGRAVAITLAELGGRVAIGARHHERLIETADEASNRGAERPFTKVLDLTEPKSITAFVQESARVLGGIDVVVNNTGGPAPGQFDDLGDDDWQQAFDLLVMSAVRVLRAALPYLRRSSHAAVVNIVSTSARQPLPSLLLSNSIRMAVMGLSKSVADEFAPFGIRVNTVLPGSVLTTRIQELVRLSAERAGSSFDDALAARTASIPLGRLGAPEELAMAVAYLASDAATYVTGASLTVDGGFSRSAL